jgi:transposase-like protein
VVPLPLSCPHCKSEKMVRNGLAPNGKQRYLCRECKRSSRENPSVRGYSEERKEEILRAYQERSSLRGLERTFGVSRYSVVKWLKKGIRITSLE